MDADDDLYWQDDQNSFRFAPDISHTDLLKVADFAEELGYDLRWQERGYTLEEVQKRLRNDGPSAFLRVARVQEDVSPKAPPEQTAQYIAERLRRLDPQDELLITDPYLFTNSAKKDLEDYAQSVADLITPLLASGAKLVTIVDGDQTHPDVRDAVLAELAAKRADTDVQVVQSKDFHDRFWIADRSRGAIIGTSLYKIGRKIFFIDALSERDVAAVLRETDAALDFIEQGKQVNEGGELTR
ncbi:hypothetical protein GGQ54_002472 [Naumannella cuiyingiana]|uniref:Uncharacterized protein n=1 Tax=Naumannella cuiyingiana TaxID=1347891 RepID=A0A7Z0DAG1_9ACTN|nr:hypothetical protein [Naumannella cuiyingiana]NYI71912.1 hypothetical protein [Naumannella cuiyingiana]